jgi:hypothetical protein
MKRGNKRTRNSMKNQLSKIVFLIKKQKMGSPGTNKAK